MRKIVKKSPRPRRRWPVRAAEAAEALLRAPLARRGFSQSRIATAWDAVVGADLAGFCRPLRLSHAARGGFGGTLTLGVLGARALEAQHLEPQIIERVNAHFGYRAVSRIRIEQIGPEAFARATPRAARAPSPEAAARIRETVAPVADDGLRAALERLGRNMAARREAAPQPTDQQK